MNVSTLKFVLRAIYHPNMLVMPAGRDNLDDYLDSLAKSISRRYNDIENAVGDIVKATGLDEHHARAVATKAATATFSGTLDGGEK